MCDWSSGIDNQQVFFPEEDYFSYYQQSILSGL